LLGITASEKYLMPVGERVPNHFYITEILCLPHYFRIDQRKVIFFAKRQCAAAMLC